MAIHIRRREFIFTLGGSAAAWPLAARAQQSERMRRIGVLVGLAENDPEGKTRLVRFRQELEHLGWLEGRNINIDYRYAPASAGAQMLAKELVALQPDAILAQGTRLSAALQRETSTIPIVFVGVTDPVYSGFVASLARPRSNLTGMLLYEISLTGKWLGMLKEMVPSLTRLLLVGNPKTIPYDYFLSAAEKAASSLSIDLVASRVASATEIESAITSFARVPDSGLVLPPDTTTVVHRDLIIALARQHRLPAVYSFRTFVTAGGLMSYGVEYAGLFQQAASYVDRILRGIKPADLPVQAPVKYETVINLKTATSLGLEVPPALLATAEEVIE
jgi:putative tryptophan/tyrosine transport system substrate-binding protein